MICAKGAGASGESDVAAGGAAEPFDFRIGRRVQVGVRARYPVAESISVTRLMAQLYAITTIWNPAGYESRSRLYKEFAKHIEKSGVDLFTVELVSAHQDFVVTEANNPRHIQLRTSHVLWYKENLVNVAIARLPKDWEYVAWLDADIHLMRSDWPERTIAELRRHALVQMFSHVVDLGPNFEILKTREGFAYLAAAGAAGEVGVRGEPGYAWAARRSAFEAVGGLIDWSVMGSNDYFMALGLAGAMTEDATRMPGSNYAAMLLRWQDRCRKHIGGDIGYVGNAIAHFWHGRRKDRGYDSRWKVLVENDFDPAIDLTRDADGLLGLSDRKPALRRAIEDYFHSRNEDSTER